MAAHPVVVVVVEEGLRPRHAVQPALLAKLVERDNALLRRSRGGHPGDLAAVTLRPRFDHVATVT